MAESKLPPEQYTFCLKMYAEHTPPSKILQYLIDNNIPHPNLRNLTRIFNYDQNQKIIEKFRQNYYARIGDVPIMNKRIRADKLQSMLNRLESTLDSKLIDKKNGTLKISKESFKKINELLKRINETLLLARDEAEKRPGTLIQIFENETTLEELLKQEKSIDEQLLVKRGAGLSIAAIGEGPFKEAETPNDSEKPA